MLPSPVTSYVLLFNISGNLDQSVVVNLGAVLIDGAPGLDPPGLNGVPGLGGVGAGGAGGVGTGAGLDGAGAGGGAGLDSGLDGLGGNGLGGLVSDGSGTPAPGPGIVPPGWEGELFEPPVPFEPFESPAPFEPPGVVDGAVGVLAEVLPPPPPPPEPLQLIIAINENISNIFFFDFFINNFSFFYNHKYTSICFY